MLTYNQEDYFEEAIDSVLNQSVLPFEIVISDDQSKDATWKIIQTYQKEYPDLIRAFRNSKNLGIYGNYERVLSLARGNIINFLSGDDFYKPDMFKNLNNAITENRINPDEDTFVIVMNPVLFYPNKREVILNNFSMRNKDPFKMSLRSSMGYRGVGISKNLLKKSTSTVELMNTLPEIKYSIDSLKGLEEASNCDKFIFIDQPSTVYRLDSGVTADSQSHIISPIGTQSLINYIKQKYIDRLDQSDLNFLDFKYAANNVRYKGSIKNYIYFIYQYFRNLNNFTENNSWQKNARYLIPKQIEGVVKKFYRLFISKKIRD